MASRRRATEFYARLESADVDQLTGVSLVYEAVRKDWRGFSEGVFALSANASGEEPPADAYWSGLFSGDLSGPDPFRDIPTARISVAYEGMSSRWRDLELDSTDWVDLVIAEEDGSEESALGEIVFEDSETASLIARIEPPTISDQGYALDRIFDMAAWPSTSAAEVGRVLGAVPALSQMIALDVGQGSAVALVDTAGLPRLYFDTGAGYLQHGGTVPPGLRFCLCSEPPIVLSHWDGDHWSGANHDPALLKRTWIAPRQRIGSSQARFANRIVRAGGQILILDRSAPVAVQLSWDNPRWGNRMAGSDQVMEILFCTGRSRNDSGLAVVVSDRLRGLSWLLTGDASYDKIPASSLGFPSVAVSVSHHGARQPRVGSLPPIRPAQPYARLLYSFGEANHYRHPTLASVTSHGAAGWHHSSIDPTDDPTGRDVLATASRRGARPRGSIAAGWRQRPRQPAHLMGCQPGLVVDR
jgi:beta-lactamase superfamily II metal-dependent hydrolase